jgi:hypothetical protein
MPAVPFLAPTCPWSLGFLHSRMGMVVTCEDGVRQSPSERPRCRLPSSGL